MILDTLNCVERYYGIHPAVRTAIEFMNEHPLLELPDGVHEIIGRSLYVIIASQTCRNREDAPLEAHRRHIDLQCPLQGTESIGWKAKAHCTPDANGYDAERDIEFFTERPETWVTVTPGTFAIFFPEDAHAPAVCEGVLRKAVFKISL